MPDVMPQVVFFRGVERRMNVLGQWSLPASDTSAFCSASAENTESSRLSHSTSS